MILVQQSQAAHFDDVVQSLSGVGEFIISPDADLGEALSENKKQVTGLVLFELTDAAMKTGEISRNERFCNPAAPIAYVGPESATNYMPFGCKRFEPDQTNALADYLAAPLPIRILIVEDDAGIRDFLSMTLSKFYQIDVAEDGDVGLKRINNNDYDAIVLDVMLPGVSGEDLFEAIQTKNKKTSIVIITAFDTEDREFRFKFNGAAAYIKKPFASNREFRLALSDALVEHHRKVALDELNNIKMSHDTAWDAYRQQMNQYL